MKIISVAPVAVGRYLLVRVRTDAGVEGIGEAGSWGVYEATAAMIDKLATYLLGEDPLRIEHHWQYIRRQSHFRGSALMAALSAIDIALWDIKGKHLGAPVWQLLSGRVRTRIRLYRHVMAASKDALVGGVAAAREEGFTAVGHLTPFLDDGRDEPLSVSPTARVDEAVATVARYREAAGPTLDLCIELHRRLSVPEALVMCRALEPFRPMFIEDPIRPDYFDAMAELAQRSPVPLATGERLTSPEEFAMLLARRGCHYLRPSPGLCGGITGTMRVAALAEAAGLQIVPHNPYGPVMSAACAQIGASVPNLAILEYSGRDEKAPQRDVVDAPPQVADGHMTVPNAPGLGIALEADAECRWPAEPRRFVTRLNTDGAVVDQ